MKKLKTIFTIGVIFAMVFTVFPAFSGNMNAYAATPKKITLNIASYNSYNTVLKWNKCKSPKKGYAVFRDGTCIKRFNTKTTSYTVASSPGAYHSYQIKVWTSKKQYYNSKKKKWQNSKPKKSQWVGKQTRYKYSYSKASNSRGVTNPKLNQTIYTDGNSITTQPNHAFTIKAYTNSGLGVTFTSSDTSVAVVNRTNGSVITKKAGLAIITISQGGNGTYNPAPNKTVRINVSGTDQQIRVNTPPSLNIGDIYQLNASATSGLPLSYESNNPNVVIVDSNGNVTAKAYGSAQIHIEQKGNGTYNYVDYTVSIQVKAANITIVFDANGGSGTMTNQTLTNGTGNLKLNTFTRQGWIFKGWHTDKSATTPKYKDGGNYTQLGNSAVTVKLYAIWERCPEPTVITAPWTINYNNKNSSGENVISLNDGTISVPINLPDGVKSVTWTKEKFGGMADGTNTIELIPTNNGKTLKIKANDALSNKGTLGQVKVKGVIEMDEGFIYYDKNGNGTANEISDRTATFTVTNTVYPMVGSISDLTYDFKYMPCEMFGNESRTLYPNDKLPANSTINININEWNGNAKHVWLKFGDEWSQISSGADCNCVLVKSKGGKMDLIKAGTFTVYFDNAGVSKPYNIVLTGSAGYMLDYHNHLVSVANSIKKSTELETMREGVIYMLTHFYYSDESTIIWQSDFGDCSDCNSYLADILRYCGIDAQFRSCGREQADHYNISVILKNGDKYIVDGTAMSGYTRDEAIYYIDSQPNSYKMRVCPWQTYQNSFSTSVTFR